MYLNIHVQSRCWHVSRREDLGVIPAAWKTPAGKSWGPRTPKTSNSGVAATNLISYASPPSFLLVRGKVGDELHRQRQRQCGGVDRIKQGVNF